MEKLVIIYNIMKSSNNDMASCYLNRLMEMVSDEAKAQGKTEREIYASLMAMVK